MFRNFATKKKTLKKVETVKLSPVSTRQANKISRSLNSKTVFSHSCDARPFTFIDFTPRDCEVHTSAPCKQALKAPLPSAVVLLVVVCRCFSRCCCSSSRWSAQRKSTIHGKRLDLLLFASLSRDLSRAFSFMSSIISQNNPVSSSHAILVSELLKQNQKIYVFLSILVYVARASSVPQL
jgi:hypothetical protein